MWHRILLPVLLCASIVVAWLPADRNLFQSNDVLTNNRKSDKLRRYLISGTDTKIRGVNLGSLFIVEPWMAHVEWVKMGCAGYLAESDCVEAIGQDNASASWANHWNTWIVKDDLKLMHSYGLNTIRIPIGWWMYEGLVGPDEHFPKGGFPFLERICEWAAELGMYVIMDLHALPGAQQVNNSFTGLITQVASFYQDSQYSRAYTFLSWLTNKIHTETAFRNVGMLEVANEPMPEQPSLLNNYYPNAYMTIRNAEASLGVSASQQLTVQFMDQNWGAGNPMSNLPGLSTVLNVAFDDHYYLAKSTEDPNQNAYINHTCSKQYDSDNMPLLTGEWSLAVNNSMMPFYINPTTDTNTFYRMYWAAQVQLFEKNMGWVFWSWKTNLGGFQWDYQKAVAAGVISDDPGDAFEIDACGSV